MSAEALLPALLLTATSLLLARWRPRMHPAWSARILLVLSTATALAFLGTLVLIVSVGAAELLPRPLPVAGVLLGHGSVPAYLAAVALAVLAGAAISVTRLVLSRRRELGRTGTRGSGVVSDDRPFAVAVPGGDGGVVVSTALLRLLSRPELEVVFRHESAHLKHRHHVYGAISAIAARVLPPLAYTHSALGFALERWADEEAAAAVGDRVLTARTIARVALASPRPEPGQHQGLADAHVARRVQALLEGAPPHHSLAGPIALGGTWMASGSAVSSALQLHHVSLLLLL